MRVLIITEKEEVLNGFKVITKRPDLTENEYKMAEYTIVNNIINSLMEHSET
ncbi:hypothetical protein [Ruminiclostridium cellulolyticum]|uniref:Uncharacterized protein n=1 Tax=Ruminiclostridium cellulolyticum (strain ATCC 35319 / DSM 5812 / JCM 6584 / H10) TaxID=394503 RepID=B8I605_RUMCH|nr:hypothetical protein [Ruminiclostridium cellulolyticum]ACL76770.1 hypothetical protein Ccel_2441 [Ruminiclostridium cellulolyticum H10]